MTTAAYSKRSLLAALLVVGLAAPARGDGPSFHYTLDDGSAYSEGCGIPGHPSPCACPVIQTFDITGAFELSALPPIDGFDMFALDGIHWTVMFQGQFEVTGSGLYLRGDAPDGSPVQQLMLQLVVDGKGPVEYDSGLIPGGGDEVPPILDLPVNDGAICYAHGFTVTATANPADIAPPGGDGVVDVLDLLAVLAAWGPCDGCAADLDGNGAVDINDLLLLLAGWG